MITAKQAKEEYGFVDCTDYENGLVLGLYNAAEGLFTNKVNQVVDAISPLLVGVVMSSCVFGMIFFGPSPMILLVMLGAGVAFIPMRIKTMTSRMQSSGMKHVRSIQGDKFLVGYGFCEEKKIEHKGIPLFLPINHYKMRVRIEKGKYIDDVIVMKPLYDDIKINNRICLFMADSENAKQIVAAPKSFTETVLDKKKIAMMQFESVDESTVRELNDAEREVYRTQYENKIQKWRDKYFKMYMIAAAVAFVGGCVGLAFKSFGGALLMWLICMYSLVITYMQNKDFKKDMKVITDSEKVRAVDVTVKREDGYKPELGTLKKANSAVRFVDQKGHILKTVRDVEMLRTFLPGDEAILIINGKELIPLHYGKTEYTMRDKNEAGPIA